MVQALLSLILAFAATAAPAPTTGNDWVDLHTHPFMDDGMGTLFHGAFEGVLRARDWRARLDSQINEASLEASGLGLWVVTFYAHPVFAYPRKERLRREIRRAQAFLKVHPEWVLARTPAQAREARAQGKRIIVFALEGASGVLESEDDLRELIDEDGIRIVTFLHLTDDHYGGVAFFHGLKILFSPVAWLTQLIGGRFDEQGNRINRNGLSDDGVAMVRKLLERHVWIDLTHASDEAQKALIPMIEGAGQPLLYTHTMPRRYLHEERGITDAQLAEVKRTHGIVGAMPSEELLDNVAVGDAAAGGTGRPPCDDGVRRFAKVYSELAAAVGAGSVDFGTDFNGGVNHLAPPKCARGTPLDDRGYWNIGQTKDVWRALKNEGVPWPASSQDFVGRFIEAWARFDSRP